MLLPALNKARRQAQATACASNLRKLGMAFQMYLQDNHNSYPPRMWRTDPSPAQWYNPNPAFNQTYWFMLISNMLSPRIPWSQTGGPLFHCPSDPNFKWASSSNRLSYGYNYYGYSTTDPAMYWSGLNTVRASSVKDPTRTILLGDSIHYGIMEGGFDDTSASFATLSAGDRHDGSANILWCDGHVDRHPKKEVDSTTAWWSRYAD
jgi:prepilin-type processing-associated H-X9-DG protein